MDTGVIGKLLNGFGFIYREGEPDIFFHSAELKEVSFDDLKVKDNVQFSIGEGPKGPMAVDVSRV